VIALYLATGALTGLTAGLLGVGGGLIVVPALAFLFARAGLYPDHLMHVALGTSLATIIVTSIASILAHQRHRAIRWPDVARIAPGLAIGALAGGLLADRIATSLLQAGSGCADSWLSSHVQSPYGLFPVRLQRTNLFHLYYAPYSNKGSQGEATSILTQGADSPSIAQ